MGVAVQLDVSLLTSELDGVPVVFLSTWRRQTSSRLWWDDACLGFAMSLGGLGNLVARSLPESLHRGTIKSLRSCTVEGRFTALPLVASLNFAV